MATQHPAVVLRSRYLQLRALLAVAMIAVIGLTVAVVILATEGDGTVTGANSASQVRWPRGERRGGRRRRAGEQRP